MHFSDRLAQYKYVIDNDLSKYSKELLSKTESEYGPYSRDTLDAFVTILARGGKRLRGTLTMTAYEMVGGTNKNMILQVARAVEMIHAYLLIIDDVADKSTMRRGGAAAHIQMQQYHTTHGLQGDTIHFGTTAATYAALIGAYHADTILDSLDVPAEIKLNLLGQVRSTLLQTYQGQLLDTLNEASPEAVSEQQALRVSELKTAHYSIINPLHVGALLGGARPSDMAILEKYGQSAGIAFQLTDDIIGMFGNEKKTGKSSMDDLREGKRTILITHTLAHANPKQRSELLGLLGRDTVSEDDLKRCREIIIDTGGLAYAKRQANDFTQRALEVLSELPPTWNKSTIQFLRDLTFTFVDRNS